MVLAWDAIFFIPAIILAVVSRVISPIITAAVHKFMVNVGFGLNPGDLSFAYVYVDEKLELSVHAPNIEHWNVQVRKDSIQKRWNKIFTRGKCSSMVNFKWTQRCSFGSAGLEVFPGAL